MTATLVSAPPRFRSVPMFASSAGQDCIDLAEGAGLVLDDWQADILRDALGSDVSGRWAAMEVGLIVPRQNGKGGLLEALELFHLFLVPTTELITHTAHRFDTCLDHFRRVRKLIEETPELVELVKDNGRGVGGSPSGIKDSNGKESIELRDGTRLNFKAREKGSGRGFSGDLVVLDEAFWLRDLSGLIPTMAARTNPQAWYTSSAPLPRDESDQLRALVRQGRALATDPAYQRPDPDDPTMAYWEWSVDHADDLESEDTLRAANPAYGIRINRRFCRMERRRMGDDVYARERLGIFSDADDAARWEVVSEANWTARRSKESPEQAKKPGWLVGPVALAVEMPQDRSRASVSVAGKCREGGVGTDVVAVGPGSSWLVAELVKLTSDESKPVSHVVIDPRSPAGSLIGELSEADVTVTECSTADLVKATGWVMDAAAEGGIVHRCSPELDEAVSVAKLRKLGESSVVDRWAERDASPFIGSILAVHGYLNPPEVPKPRSGVVYA